MSKAYKSTNDEGITVVVWAKDANKARAAVHVHESGDFCDMDYTDIRMHRAPDFDKYDGLLPSAKTLMHDHGWHIFCSRCCIAVYDTSEGHVWVDDDTVLCENCAGKKEACMP